MANSDKYKDPDHEAHDDKKIKKKKSRSSRKHQHQDFYKYKKIKADKELENGPIKNRGCTDIIFCLLFTVFVGYYIYAVVMGIATGDPEKLITPFDEDGNGCGYSAGFEDYPYLYFYRVSHFFWFEREFFLKEEKKDKACFFQFCASNFGI